MKNVMLIIGAILAFPGRAAANPACAVCTVTIGASLSLARKLGVEDSIVGLWAGALLTLLGYWTIVLFDKKGWSFAGRNTLLILVSVAMIGFIYVREAVYSPKVVWQFFYMDVILFGAILGMLIYVFSQKLYQRMKAHNGGHAHFPFEKVVLPLVLLFAASLYLTYFPI